MDRSPSRSPWPALLVGVAALGALVVAVVHFGDAERFLALATTARPAWLALAVVLQAATYAAQAGAWSPVLRRAGSPRPFGELYALSLVDLFASQAVPTAGVAGSVLVVRALTRRGVSEAAAVAAVLVDLVGYYVAFGLAMAFAVAVLVDHHDLSPALLAAAGAAAALGVGVVGATWWVTAPGRRVPAWVERRAPLARVVAALRSADPALLRDPALVTRAAGLRALNVAFDGLSLWTCLRAVGDPVPMVEATAALVMGAVARTVGVIPGGLGTFEGGAVGGLALFGVALEPALAATLLFRGFSFWIPMLPGLWLARRLTRG